MHDIIKYELKILERCRKNTFGIASRLTLDEMNHIPYGFNNNIFWNIGHMLVTQHQIMYGLSGNKIELKENWIAGFKPGSKPEEPYSSELFKELKEASRSSIEVFPKEYNNGKFDKFKPFETLYGNLIRNIDEAIIFNNVHENIHLGMILSLRRAVQHRQ